MGLFVSGVKIFRFVYINYGRVNSRGLKNVCFYVIVFFNWLV